MHASYEWKYTEVAHNVNASQQNFNVKTLTLMLNVQ